MHQFDLWRNLGGWRRGREFARWRRRQFQPLLGYDRRPFDRQGPIRLEIEVEVEVEIQRQIQVKTQTERAIVCGRRQCLGSGIPQDRGNRTGRRLGSSTEKAVAGSFIHQTRRDLAPRLQAGEQEHGIAQHGNGAWDPLAVVIDALDNSGGEKSFTRVAGSFELMVDKQLGFHADQPFETATNLGLLVQPPQLGLTQLALDFRQTRQHDLQALTGLRRRFHEIPQVVQYANTQVVGIVDQQGDRLVAARMRSHGIQHPLALLLDIQIVDRQLQAGAQIVKDVGKIEGGVSQQDEGNVVGFRHAPAQHQRLTQPGFAGQQHEPTLLPDTIQDVGASAVEVIVAVIIFEIFRFKRFIVKTEVGGIHPPSSTLIPIRILKLWSSSP